MCQPLWVCVAVSTARCLSSHSLGCIAYYSLLAFAVYQQRVMRLSSCRVLATCQAVPLSCLCAQGGCSMLTASTQYPGVTRCARVCAWCCCCCCCCCMWSQRSPSSVRRQTCSWLGMCVCVCMCLHKGACVWCLSVCLRVADLCPAIAGSVWVGLGVLL